MNDDEFFQIKEFQKFMIRNIMDEIERRKGIKLDSLKEDERLWMKD